MKIMGVWRAGAVMIRFRGRVCTVYQVKKLQIVQMRLKLYLHKCPSEFLREGETIL